MAYEWVSEWPQPVDSVGVEGLHRQRNIAHIVGGQLRLGASLAQRYHKEVFTQGYLRPRMSVI